MVFQVGILRTVPSDIKRKTRAAFCTTEVEEDAQGQSARWKVLRADGLCTPRPGAQDRPWTEKDTPRNGTIYTGQPALMLRHHADRIPLQETVFVVHDPQAFRHDVEWGAYAARYMSRLSTWDDARSIREGHVVLIMDHLSEEHRQCPWDHWPLGVGVSVFATRCTPQQLEFWGRELIVPTKEHGAQAPWILERFHCAALPQWDILMDATHVQHTIQGPSRDFGSECVICYEERGIVHLNPCGHCICPTCLHQVPRCPVCRESIQGISREVPGMEFAILCREWTTVLVGPVPDALKPCVRPWPDDSPIPKDAKGFIFHTDKVPVTCGPFLLISCWDLACTAHGRIIFPRIGGNA